jgi:hypothetical protein
VKEDNVKTNTLEKTSPTTMSLTEKIRLINRNKNLSKGSKLITPIAQCSL